MKMKVSKKFAVTLAAGVLALAMAIGGTYAWFTSTATSGDAEFTVATVKLDDPYDLGNGYRIFKFADADALNFQKFYMEPIANNPIIPERDLGALANFALYAPILIGPNWYNDIFVNAPNSGIFDEEITPGSFAYTELKFSNLSTVHTFLRIKAADLNRDKQMHAAYFVFITNSNGDIINYDAFATPMILTASFTDAIGKDTCFYLNMPLPPASDPVNGDEYSVKLCAYVFGGINNAEDWADPITGKIDNFTLGTLTAEVIQAANNAVFLANDGWSAFTDANPTFFIEPSVWP